MSSTISFKNDKLSDKTVEIKSIGALTGVVKYVPKKNIPKVEEKSVLIYTTDTTELFIGGGMGQPIKRVSDIITVPDINALPDVGIKDKLYVSIADKIIYFWNDTDGFQQVGSGNGSGGGSVIQTRIMEYPTTADFPPTGQAKAIYIAKNTDFLYRFDIDTSKYIQLARQSYDPTIAAKFNTIDIALANKADKADLAKYHAKSDKITESDFDINLTAKLNTNLVPYNDNALKSRIAGVEMSKVDKTALDDYRKTTDVIAEADLDAALKSKLNSIPAAYDDTAIKNDIASLDLNKADKTSMLDYRKNAIKITEADLDGAARAKLNTPAYNDTAIKTDISALQTNSATKNEMAMALAGVLKTTDKLTESNLDSALVAKINTAANGYDDTAIKADISALQADSVTKNELVAATANVLKNTDKIGEINLAAEVINKLNAAATGYDDTIIKSRVVVLETGKTDMTYSEATYLKKTDKVTQEQLPIELTNKISSIENDLVNKANKGDVSAITKDLTDLATDVNNLTSSINNKADKSDLTAIQNNITTIQNDLADAKNDINALETAVTTKADKTDLDSYRQTTDKITASDLDSALVSEVQKVPSIEINVADLLARVAALEAAAPVILTIESVNVITDKNVAYGTMWNDLGLPTNITATLSDNTTVSAAVVWESRSYSSDGVGVQKITGIITLPSGVTNPKNIMAEVNIIMSAAVNAPFDHEFTFENPTDTVTGKLLDEISPDLRFTTDEFYTTCDVKVYYLGTEPLREFADNPKHVPTSVQAGEGMSVTTPDGYVDFDEDPSVGGKVYFSGGSLGTRVYKIVRT